MRPASLTEAAPPSSCKDIHTNAPMEQSEIRRNGVASKKSLLPSVQFRRVRIRRIYTLAKADIQTFRRAGLRACIASHSSATITKPMGSREPRFSQVQPCVVMSAPDENELTAMVQNTVVSINP